MLDVDTNPAAIMLNIDDMNILVVGSRSSRCLVIRVILAHIELHYREHSASLYCQYVVYAHVNICCVSILCI